MRKFLAVLKREYWKIVWTKLFLITTFLAPVGLLALVFVPTLMFSIKGNAVRLAVVEDDGKFYKRLSENLTSEKQYEKYKKATEDKIKNLDNSQDEKLKQSANQIGGNFALQEFQRNEKSDEELKTALNQQIADGKLDAYLLIPQNSESKDAKFEFYSRNSSDFVSNNVIQEAINDSIRLERLSKVNISEEKLKEINQKVDFTVKAVDKKGDVSEGSDLAFPIGFGLAMLLYMTITIYGSSVLGAIVEEKETKIAEILFSSAKPFQLMMGKLCGVCLAGLTQVGIWIFSALAVATYFVVMFADGGGDVKLPNITPFFVVNFFIFFLIGFFLYATIYALIGSMVTTTQEGGQFVVLTVIILMIGLYSVIPIVRDPNSTFSTIVSLVPFVSPISMPVRIFIEQPPIWQILLSILLNLLAICGVIWVASRVYRIGMLMYGKRATIPEVWRWIRTS